MSEIEGLAGSARCLLAFWTGSGPLLTPMAFWYDGAALWMTTAASSVKVAALRRQPRCAAYVPPADDGSPGVVVHGSARVYGAHDPVALVVHAPVLSAAMGALAVSDPGTVLEYARDAARTPQRWLPRNRVVLRMTAAQAQPAPAVKAGPGVAPALPTSVPADVRRALAGRRRVVLASVGPDGLRVGPATWSAGFLIDAPAAFRAQPDSPAVVTVLTDLHAAPPDVVGLSLRGPISADQRLRPTRATFWRGLQAWTVDVSPVTGGVTLPD